LDTGDEPQAGDLLENGLMKNPDRYPMTIPVGVFVFATASKSI
jgi:hypothetical protein